jgi:hypothetical protein
VVPTARVLGPSMKLSERPHVVFGQVPFDSGGDGHGGQGDGSTVAGKERGVGGMRGLVADLLGSIGRLVLRCRDVWGCPMCCTAPTCLPLSVAPLTLAVRPEAGIYPKKGGPWSLV